MSRYFNTAGPCKPDLHYMLPPLARLPNIQRLISQQAYFVLHAPRQVGKTTAMLTLAQQLTASGEYVAAVLSMQPGAAFKDDIAQAERAILDGWRETLSQQLPAAIRPPEESNATAGAQILAALGGWARAAPRPLVLFLDEVDALQDQTLISILHQLRTGYTFRPKNFPWSLAIIGLRDVRDYKVASGGSAYLHTASPFNIKMESLTLRNFTAVEVAELYQQHTADTGQIFTAEAMQLAYDLTQGQPWLVNALARQATEALVSDPTQPISAAHIIQAKEILIQRQDTHLDSLAERLREPRVRAIIEPMLAGEYIGDIPDDDRRYVLDLGLARRDPQDGFGIANPIYREIIPRILTRAPQDNLPSFKPIWLRADGTLDAERLLQAFLVFWRQHGEILQDSAPYREVAPHLVLLAFLHRVINGGGTLEREYAIGRGRMDLCLRYGAVTLGIELKAWREGKRDPLAEGLVQLDEYLSGLSLDRGWLVIFDQRKGQPPISERTITETATTPHGRAVIVIRA